MQKKDYRKEAKQFIKRGISVIPLRTDGSKLPKIEWKDYQSRFMLDWEIELHCKNCGGLAGITGSLSKLVCIDFDLDKQLETQDFWGEFNKLIPKKLKKKFKINQTRSMGFHVWLKVDGFNFPSRKMSHRRLTIPEMHEKYLKYVEEKKDDPRYDPEAYQLRLQNKPLECVVETRFEGSYGVIMHESYAPFYGDKLHTITLDEWIVLENAMYSLDCGFKSFEPYKGNVDSYRLITKYLEDTTPEMVVDMLVDTGLYGLSRQKTDREGNYLLQREGSSSSYSCKVFSDTGMIFDHGMSNIFTDGKATHNVFELFCELNRLNEQEALKLLEERYYG